MSPFRTDWPPSPVVDAVRIIGGAAAVARLCNVTPRIVNVWMRAGNVPGLREALAISRASGVPVERLAGESEPADRSADT